MRVCMPDPSRISLVASAEARTWAGSKSGKLTEGMRTSRSRSARMSGIKAWMRCSMSVVMTEDYTDPGDSACRAGGVQDLGDGHVAEAGALQDLLQELIGALAGDHGHHHVQAGGGQADLPDRAEARRGHDVRPPRALPFGTAASG